MEEKHAPMAVDLHAVLPGIGVRREKACDKNLVNCLLIVIDKGVANPVWL